MLPPRCVFAAAAAETCAPFVDHYRSRKTGPGFAVAVVGCGRHPLGRYTLYPPGHLPYGRQAVVPCSPSGPLLRDRSTGQPVWAATLWAAATEAADGQRWPAASPADEVRRRRTQGGRLALAGQLLGVHPELDARTRERLATRLRVPTMTLREAARGWGTCWQARGAACLAVLLALPIDHSLLDRIPGGGCDHRALGAAPALGAGTGDVGALPFQPAGTPWGSPFAEPCPATHGFARCGKNGTSVTSVP